MNLATDVALLGRVDARHLLILGVRLGYGFGGRQKNDVPFEARVIEVDE